jgi:N-methylhydantoinase B
MVLLDVLQGKVSAESARDDYGVVLVGKGDDLEVDEAATWVLRRRIAEAREDLPLIDRGPGYENLRTQAQ